MMINGFLVVRLPQENQLFPSQHTMASVNGVHYAGLDRGAWCDVFDEDYYTARTPARVATSAKLLRNDCIDTSGIVLARDFGVALKLLDYSNRSHVKNEIIAIRSQPLAETRGLFDPGIAIEWLGLDVVGEGEWSLIAGGIFSCTKHFLPWEARINANGLFDDPIEAREYERAYQQAVSLGHAEELACRTEGPRILLVNVGRTACCLENR